jgi:hypothetical protein
MFVVTTVNTILSNYTYKYSYNACNSNYKQRLAFQQCARFQKGGESLVSHLCTERLEAFLFAAVGYLVQLMTGGTGPGRQMKQKH